MPHENLCKKYGIDREKLYSEGIYIVGKALGNICDSNVLLAIACLLAYGDIPIENEEK